VTASLDRRNRGRIRLLAWSARGNEARVHTKERRNDVREIPDGRGDGRRSRREVRRRRDLPRGRRVCAGEADRNATAPVRRAAPERGDRRVAPRPTTEPLRRLP